MYSIKLTPCLKFFSTIGWNNIPSVITICINKILFHNLNIDDVMSHAPTMDSRKFQQSVYIAIKHIINKYGENNIFIMTILIIPLLK